MSRQKEKIYRRRRPVKTFFKVLGIVLLVLILLAILVFFWFQRYIHYTSDGVRLDIPFLRGILDEIPQEEELGETATLIIESPSPTPPASADPAQSPDTTYALIIGAEDFSDSANWLEHLSGLEKNTLMVLVKDGTGELGWKSSVHMAEQYDLNGQADLTGSIESVGEDIRLSAVLYCFTDELMAARNLPAALDEDSDTAWLDPANEAMQTYITDLCLELGDMGFDEIVLYGFSYPTDATVAQAQQDQVVLDFLQKLAEELSDINVELSLITEEANWLEGEGLPVYSMDLEALAGVASRFYCVLEETTIADTDSLSSLCAAASDLLGSDTRFIPGGIGIPSSYGSWEDQ